jgi:hypothetical protein
MNSYDNQIESKPALEAEVVELEVIRDRASR